MKLLKFVLVFLIVAVLASCSSFKHRKTVCSGLLKIGTTSKAFTEIWGLPEKTKITSGEQMMTAGFGGGRGHFFRGRATYQVWDYGEVKLIFDRKLRLSGWDTNKTTTELAAVGKENCKKSAWK